MWQFRSLAEKSARFRFVDCSQYSPHELRLTGSPVANSVQQGRERFFRKQKAEASKTSACNAVCGLIPGPAKFYGWNTTGTGMPGKPKAAVAYVQRAPEKRSRRDEASEADSAAEQRGETKSPHEQTRRAASEQGTEVQAGVRDAVGRRLGRARNKRAVAQNSAVKSARRAMEAESGPPLPGILHWAQRARNLLISMSHRVPGSWRREGDLCRFQHSCWLDASRGEIVGKILNRSSHMHVTAEPHRIRSTGVRTSTTRCRTGQLCQHVTLHRGTATACSSSLRLLRRSALQHKESAPKNKR